VDKRQALALLASFVICALVAAVTMPLPPDGRETGVVTVDMFLGIMLVLVGFGFASVIFMDVTGQLNDDDDGPNWRPPFTWTGAFQKLAHVGNGCSGLGCGMLLHGLMVTPHNYFGLIPLCFGIGQFLGIWLALAWPPRPGQ
jgi:hypothetical protein